MTNVDSIGSSLCNTCSVF